MIEIWDRNVYELCGVRYRAHLDSAGFLLRPTAEFTTPPRACLLVHPDGQISKLLPLGPGSTAALYDEVLLDFTIHDLQPLTTET